MYVNRILPSRVILSLFLMSCCVYCWGWIICRDPCLGRVCISSWSVYFIFVVWLPIAVSKGQRNVEWWVIGVGEDDSVIVVLEGGMESLM